MPVAGQQGITVSLIDAKSGKPVPYLNVTAEWCEGNSSFADCGEAALHTGANGFAILTLPVSAKTFSLIAGPKESADPYRHPYGVCNGPSGDFQVSIETIIKVGVVPTNTCDQSVHVHATPGSIVYYIIPLHWWDIDFQ
jgi:hypothetical protein